MNILFLLGRLVVGAYYLKNAYNHLANGKNLIPYAKSMNAPMPEFTVPFGGILLLVGGLSVLTGLYVQLGVLCLVAFFLPVTFIMHAYWKVQDPQMKGMQQVQFNKNMALMGSALMFLAIPAPWTFTL